MKDTELIDRFANLLAVVGKYYHWHLVPNLLTEALPPQQIVDDAYLKLADIAGFDAKITQYKTGEFLAFHLPLILFSKNIPILIQEYSSTRKKYLVIDEYSHEKWLTRDEVEEMYGKKIILLKPKFSSPSKRNQVSSQKHWLWNSLKFSTSLYVDVFLATFLLNVFALLTPLFIRNVYDRVIPNAAFDTLYVLSSGIVIVYLFDMLFRFLRTYLLELAGKKSDIIVSSLLFEHILNIQLANKFKSVGAFVNNIKEFDTLRNFFSSVTLTMLIDLPFVLLFLFVIYIFAGNIVLMPIIAGMFIILYGVAISGTLKKYIDKSSEIGAWKNGMLVESLSALETVKSLNINRIMQWRWEESVGEMSDIGMKTKMLTTSMSTITSFGVQLANVLVVIAGVYAIHEEKLTMGGLIAITMLTSRALMPLAQISSLIVNYEHARSSYDLLNKIFAMPVERDSRTPYIYRDTIQGKIEFRGVSFAYDNTEQPVFENLNFTIEAGESVGILGENGSGKSTLLKLIMGFYTPSKGSVLIDGIDTRQIDPLELRSRLNYFAQDCVLFQGTIQENILYGNPNASTEKITATAEKSGLSNFVNNHPNGYGLQVGERGENLSGGQKKLVALTRLLIKDDSSIVVVDEPTDNLDTQTEITVLDAIQEYTNDKTLLMVTHKKNALHIVSRIIIVGKGKIIFDGPKEEAMQLFSKGKS